MSGTSYRDGLPPAELRYPATPRLDVWDDLHGRTIHDPYRWLEDAGDPQVDAWLKAQDDLFTQERQHWPGYNDVQRRVTELFDCGGVSAPVWRGDRLFLARRSPGDEHAVVLMRDADAAERVLLHPAELDESGQTTIDSWHPSPDGKLLAYRLSHGGTEESSLFVLDVTTGTIIDGPIDRVRNSPVAWLPDATALYYVRRLPPESVPHGEERFHRRIFLHRIGSQHSDDEMVFGDGLDKTTHYQFNLSDDGRWLAVTAKAGTAPRNDVWLADLTAPMDSRWRCVQHGRDARSSLRVGQDGRAYISTTHSARRGRLCVTTPADPAEATWRVLIPEDPEAVLDDYLILDGEHLAEPLLLVSWVRHAASELSLHLVATGRRIATVPLPGLGKVNMLTKRDGDGHEAWFVYSGYTTPPTVLRYDAETRTLDEWERSPGSVAIPETTTQQVVYKSLDGTSVRMFVIARSITPDVPRPTILFGYGGFGLSLRPVYSAAALAWVEAGGVYAVANLRGGSEDGDAWHRAGIRDRKQNVFDDFAAAATWLCDNGWTRRDQLGMVGGSNGGLLVAGELAQHPELFGAAVCIAPLSDMVRYEQSGLGRTWVPEYGSAENPIELDWLLAYSPYHNIRPGRPYPATMIVAFDGDSRVDPLHARKLTAALQHATTGSAPIVLRSEAGVGHHARAASRTVGLTADILTFLALHLSPDAWQLHHTRLPGGLHLLGEAMLRNEKDHAIEGSSVCLVSMPYTSLSRPSLALGLLKGILLSDGIETSVVYADLSFAEQVGLHRYQRCVRLPITYLAGEWTFAAAAFPSDPERPEKDSQYLSQMYETWERGQSDAGVSYRQNGPEELSEDLTALRAAAPSFVDDTARRIINSGVRIVGCTSTFQQHVASLALLRRIRELAPDVITMLGGANCETVMGETTYRCFPWLDYVVSGEADDIITSLCRVALTRGREAEAGDLPRSVIGPWVRKHGRAQATGNATPRAIFSKLDSLPTAVFDDYFEALGKSSLRPNVKVGLPIETSRGCWWGAIHQCTFCGLNGTGMSFRSKSAERVMAELNELELRYGVSNFEAVDNILDMRYHKTLLPMLAKDGRQRQFFYEIKANVTRHQLEAMQQAGINWIQPGIESLHTSVLRLMDKGVKGWQNVQLLKWSSELGLRVAWSILLDFPGEKDEWYQTMAEWIPLMEHMQPPFGVTQVRFDRYSVYHENARDMGLKLFPIGAMRYVYPLDEGDLGHLSYFFSTEPGTGPLQMRLGREEMMAKRSGIRAVVQAAGAWSARFNESSPALVMTSDQDGELRISDSRSGATSPVHTLTGLDRAVCLACDAAPRREKIAEIVARDFALLATDEEIGRACESLVDARLVVGMDERLVGLALRCNPPPLPRSSQFPGGYVTTGRIRSRDTSSLCWSRRCGASKSYRDAPASHAPYS